MDIFNSAQYSNHERIIFINNCQVGLKAINLLDELKNHALKPQFRTTVDIKKGEVVAWDAYCTLHKATPQKIATGENDARLLWRASMVGTAPVLEKYQSL